MSQEDGVNFFIITDTLEEADESGLIAELVDEFWKDDFKFMNYQKRRIIRLNTSE